MEHRRSVRLEDLSGSADLSAEASAEAEAGHYARVVMQTHTRRTYLMLIAAVVTLAGVAHAQLRVKAEITPIVESERVHAGSTVRAALQVRLPKGFHVQSNKPRDSSLIPTVLTLDAPAGVSVAEIVFPPPTDLSQIGQSQPLAVFEQDFAIGVSLEIGRAHV